MNFMREQALKTRRQALNGYVKKLDAGFRSLKKDYGFTTARLTKDHHDSGQVRSELAEEKMGSGSLESGNLYAFCGIIKRGWTTMPSQVAIYWNSTVPSSRQSVVKAMQDAGLVVTNPNDAHQAVVVNVSEAA